MPNATVPAFPASQYVLVNVVDIDNDGSTPDVTETLTVSSNAPAIAAVVVAPGNPRQVKITGLAPGGATIIVGAPGVPVGATLNLTVTVSAAPNLSRIDLVDILGPFPV